MHWLERVHNCSNNRKMQANKTEACSSHATRSRMETDKIEHEKGLE